MARFGFRKQGPDSGSEDEGLPPLEGDLGDSGGAPAETEPSVSEDEERGGRTRRIIILAGIGAILIGGAYLANQLFLAPAPAPTPVKPAVPAPQAKGPGSAAPPVAQKAASPSAAPTPAPEKAATKAGPPLGPPAPTAKPVVPATAPPPAKTMTSEKPPLAPSKAEAKTVAKAEPSKAGAKPSPAPAATYSLQVGAMVVEENAQNLRRRLDESGFPASVRKGTAFVTKHVVTVGDPAEKRDAEELARRLNVDGFPSQLLAVGGKFTPQIGAFFNLDEAIDLARELQKKNYRPKISSNPANTVVYQVRLGRFESRSSALKRGEQLKAKGFTYLVVRN